MMVLHRPEQSIEHRQFSDLKGFVRPGDLMVLNDTRVHSARRFSDDRTVEFLFLERLGRKQWKCLTRPGRRARVGVITSIAGVRAKVDDVLPNGERVISLQDEIDLFTGGSMPLPPYVRRESDALDEEQYQTVFARAPGAVAAPTAGLHFTKSVLAELPHVFVTLHVGPGTFRPVRAQDITEHKMPGEKFSITAETATRINQAERLIAVGTTTVRVLESAAARHAGAEEPDADGRNARHRIEAITDALTTIFIHPPFEFRAVDILLTNFHLPRSTLLMLVSAFAGREFTLRAYEEAVREQYRFFSYGDCMLIL